MNADVTPIRRPQAAVPEVWGDHLNAQRFLDEHGRHVRHSPELGRWWLWNGAWWAEDRLGRVLELASDTIDGLRLWVAEGDDFDERKRRWRHYEASARAGRRDALLSVAGTNPAVAVAVEQLDSHPMLLACRNGTVDLATGELRPANPTDLLTRGVDVDYIPGAFSDRWTAFIASTFNGDAELAGYVQRLLGYCITGVVRDHIVPVLVGSGANGKSTLIGVVQDLLGEHAITAPEGLVLRRDHDPHPERLAVLRGRRLVVSAELEQRAVLAESVVKMLSGGDTISARELYGRRFNFEPSHKVVLVTNHRPRVHGTDMAIWRRLRVVPFTITIALADQDPQLRHRFATTDATAVLAWLVDGATAWHRHGLGHAQAIDDATADYRTSQDTFGIWLDERTIAAAGHRTKMGSLWEAWRTWCEQAGERPGRKQDFAAAIATHGYTIETYQGAKHVCDLGLRSFGEVS